MRQIAPHDRPMIDRLWLEPVAAPGGRSRAFQSPGVLVEHPQAHVSVLWVATAARRNDVQQLHLHIQACFAVRFY